MALSTLDPGQVTKDVHDATNSALRVNVVATSSTGSTVDITSGTGSGDKATVTAAKALKVDGSAVTQPVSGTFFQATQPVSGTVTANAGTGTFATSSTLDSSSTSSCTNVSGNASSVSLLASTAGRKGAYFFNDSTAILYLKFGTTASTTSYTVQIQPGGFFEMPPKPVYTGAIDGIWSAANGACRITELT